MYVAHRGSDSAGRPMDSGYQVQQINHFAVTDYFWRLVNGVSAA